MKTNRYEVKAWGHPTLPDLDFISTALRHTELRWQYPYVSVRLLDAVSVDDIERWMQEASIGKKDG